MSKNPSAVQLKDFVVMLTNVHRSMLDARLMKLVTGNRNCEAPVNWLQQQRPLPNLSRDYEIARIQVVPCENRDVIV